jgi:hypothetical protein
VGLTGGDVMTKARHSESRSESESSKAMLGTFKQQLTKLRGQDVSFPHVVEIKLADFE